MNKTFWMTVSAVGAAFALAWLARRLFPTLFAQAQAAVPALY